MSTRMHDRLVNWGRYWRDYRGVFPAVPLIGSLETGYLRQLDSRLEADAVQEEQASKMPDPEMRDAIVVNDAWKKCSRDTKDMLKFSFCFGRVTDHFVAKRCDLREEQLPLRFSRAVREIRRMLDEPAIARTIPPDNSCTRADKPHPSDSDEPTAQSAVNSKVAASPREMQEID